MMQLEVDSPKCVVRVEEAVPPPPLTVLSLRMLTILNQKTKSNEVGT